MAATRDHELGPGCRDLPGLLQVRTQLGEEGYRSRIAASVVFGLGAVHDESVVRPVDVRPAEVERLGGAPKTAEPAEGEQHPPLRIRALLQHPESLVECDEVEP